MPQNYYPISTTALDTTPAGAGTTVGSGNTQAASWTVLRTMVDTGLAAGVLDGTSQTWSFHIVISATSGLFASRFKLQRRDSTGAVQSESGYFTLASGGAISATTYDGSVTWASGTWNLNDQLALVWEGFRTSGTGNKSGTIDAGSGASYVAAPVPAGTEYTETATIPSVTTLSATELYAHDYTEAAICAAVTTVSAVEVRETNQVGVPISDITSTGWTPSVGTTLYGCIDEDSPDDADYIYATAA